jgi:ribonuclease HI
VSEYHTFFGKVLNFFLWASLGVRPTKNFRRAPATPGKKKQGKGGSSYFLDGGCDKTKNGSASFVCYCHKKVELHSSKLSFDQSTNNIAEFEALLKSLQHASAKQLKRILIVSDSELVANFIKGKNRITHDHLIAISIRIIELAAKFDAIYVSHIKAHQKVSLENDVADALCTWSIKTGLCFYKASDNAPRYLASALPMLVSRAAPHHPPSGCSVCCQPNHKMDNCPIKRFVNIDFNQPTHCLGCLSPSHSVQQCPILAMPKRRPVLSTLVPPIIEPSLTEHERASAQAGRLYDTNLLDWRFPINCNIKQFMDYWNTVFLAILHASNADQVAITKTAIKAWNEHYYFIGDSIRYKRPRPSPNDNCDNHNSPPKDPEEDLARRVLRAAKLFPKARPKLISKALRTGDKVPLINEIVDKIQQCYPLATPEEHTRFEPKPLPTFSVSRDALARVIMSGDPSSHPGASGNWFAIFWFFFANVGKKKN